MPKQFPDRVDPWRLLGQEQIIQGEIVLASMGRLSRLLNEAGRTDKAVFSLAFSRDRQSRAVIDCSISTTLVLTCQRCLEPMTSPVEIDSRLALVKGFEEAERLPEELEPLMLAGEGLLQVRELVEDELLLAVPDAPRHADNECALRVPEYMEEGAAEESAQAKTNPFDILAVLKDN